VTQAKGGARGEKKWGREQNKLRHNRQSVVGGGKAGVETRSLGGGTERSFLDEPKGPVGERGEILRTKNRVQVLCPDAHGHV